MTLLNLNQVSVCVLYPSSLCIKLVCFVGASFRDPINFSLVKQFPATKLQLGWRKTFFNYSCCRVRGEGMRTISLYNNSLKSQAPGLIYIKLALLLCFFLRDFTDVLFLLLSVSHQRDLLVHFFTSFGDFSTQTTIVTLPGNPISPRLKYYCEMDLDETNFLCLLHPLRPQFCSVFLFPVKASFQQITHFRSLIIIL